jgi:hypothetical protein
VRRRAVRIITAIPGAIALLLVALIGVAIPVYPPEHVPRPDGSSDFYAAGDRGQHVSVSPTGGVIIVCMGVEYGIGSPAWTGGFSRAARALD